ncbi:hypothetical protein AMJ50_02855 [Parcubacteria bacterium DG_74_3]|nr:MAG: hypothetical protein AMJ50_02855 [Parcubacteria bacterium DG_74_3]
MPEKSKDEKLEFLKREEIRTMQKDIARLRESEAQKERERIAALKSEKVKKIVREKAPEEKPAEKEEKISISRLPKPSPFKKYSIRLLVLLIFFLLAGSFIWFFVLPKVPLGEIILWVEPPTEKETIPPLEETPAPKEELKDRAGQLFIVGFEESTLTPELKEFFIKYKPGGVLLLSANIKNKEQLKNLISDLQNLSLEQTGLPLLIAVDQEGEPMSRIFFLEEKTSQVQIANSGFAFQVGLGRGQELKDLGVNLNLAPVLDDIKKEDFYFGRTFQRPPEIAGELAISLILGQKEAGILTAIKHFPGYVGISFDPRNKLTEISSPEISQFKKAMEANPELVMMANVIYRDVDPALPLIFSSPGVQFLKDNLGSDILIISEDLAQNALLANFSLKDIVTKPIEAGIDILLFSGWRVPAEDGLEAFFAALEKKEVSEEKINAAISRIINLKQTLK